jgi:general secretion pathway protein L
MKLRIFLPTIERPDAATRFAWMLFDARRDLLRDGTTPLADAPRADEIEAVVPSSRVLFARLKLPKVSAATIRQLLPYAVEDRLLADPSHIHAVAGRTHNKGETIVAVVDRDWLRAMLDALARADIRPHTAWSESSLLAGGSGDWNLVLWPKGGMLVDDDGVSATFDHDASRDMPLALRVALDEAASRGERPTSIRVHREGEMDLPDLARWSAETGVAFAPGTQWEKLARDEPASNAINLLQGEFAPGAGRRTRLPRAALALAASIAVLQLAFVTLDAWRLQHERSNIEARREAIFRAAFPEAKVVVDPELQMKRNLAELKRSRGMAAEDDFLASLSRAARESEAPARSIEYSNGKLVVRRGEKSVAEAPK